jgi:hypothetical protein
MPNLEEVKAQLKNISGSDTFMSSNDVKALPGILWENETIENAIRGFYNEGNGLLVATNNRLFFVNKGIFSLKVEDFPYDKITTIQYESGILLGKITIYTSGNKAVIDNTAKGPSKTFSEWLRNRINNKSTTAPVQTISPAPSTESSAIDQIKKLAELKDAGVLTEEEFTAKKKQLLGI